MWEVIDDKIAPFLIWALPVALLLIVVKWVEVEMFLRKIIEEGAKKGKYKTLAVLMLPIPVLLIMAIGLAAKKFVGTNMGERWKDGKEEDHKN